MGRTLSVEASILQSWDHEAARRNPCEENTTDEVRFEGGEEVAADVSGDQESSSKALTEQVPIVGQLPAFAALQPLSTIGQESWLGKQIVNRGRRESAFAVPGTENGGDLAPRLQPWQHETSQPDTHEKDNAQDCMTTAKTWHVNCPHRL
jgi:hypothetical protein